MTQDPLVENTGRIGKWIRCTACGCFKQPRGRSAPIGLHFCNDECPGYRLAPLPGNLWGGESEADFGYCDTCGMPFREGRCTGAIQHGDKP